MGGEEEEEGGGVLVLGFFQEGLERGKDGCGSGWVGGWVGRLVGKRRRRRRFECATVSLGVGVGGWVGGLVGEERNQYLSSNQIPPHCSSFEPPRSPLHFHPPFKTTIG